MKYLVTGGCGFLGTNIAAHVLNQNDELIVFDNLYRLGCYQNLNSLKSQGQFLFIHGDIRNTNDVTIAIQEHKPDVIFHLAGQVAMTTSIVNPRMDFEINVLGTLNVLEAVKNYSSESIIIYSSTNKVYGDLEYVEYQELEKRYICPQYPRGFDEKTSLDFHSPYGCSKGAADQYVLDYYRMYKIRTVVFRHSSIYGSHQFSTYDQGWIGWFCQKALNDQESFTISGNGKQVRDVLYASDAISCYLAAVKYIDTAQGQAFNIGGGFKNSLSLLELFDMLTELTDAKLKYEKLPERISDQKVFIADISKASQKINWTPKISCLEGIKNMLNWLQQ